MVEMIGINGDFVVNLGMYGTVVDVPVEEKRV